MSDEDRLSSAMEVARAAFIRAARTWQASLRSFPTDGTCLDCGNGYYYTIVEYGYWRHTSASADSGTLWASTDGWDDMSESGDVEHVECVECGACYQLPDNTEWN